MIQLFYTIWGDCLNGMKANPKNKYTWKLWAMVSMVFCQIVNFMFLDILVDHYILHLDFYNKIYLNIFNNSGVNMFLNFLILLVLPFLIINYFLIFYKQKYKSIMNKYPYRNGRYFIWYLCLSGLVPIVILWIGIIYVNLK